MGNTKSCSECGIDKDVSLFYKRKTSKDGCRSACKECDNNRTKKYRKSNPDVIRAIKKKSSSKNREKTNRYYRENPRYSRQSSSNRRARKRGAFVECIDRDVLYNLCGGVCYICSKRVERYSWHLEHVVPLVSGGKHSYENTQIAHSNCNQVKSEKSLTRFMYEVNYGTN